MNARGPTGAETWPLSQPPTRKQTRWAIAVAVCQVAALALLAPFAKTQLAEINAFIPAFEGVIFVTDLITSVPGCNRRRHFNPVVMASEPPCCDAQY
jgi:hypothetical protein